MNHREPGRYGGTYYQDEMKRRNPLEEVLALIPGLPPDCAGYRPDKSKFGSTTSGTGDVTLAVNPKGLDAVTEEDTPPREEMNSPLSSIRERDKEKKASLSEIAGGFASNFVNFMTRTRGIRGSKKSIQKDAIEVEQPQLHRATRSGDILKRAPPFMPASPRSVEYQWIRFGQSARNREDRLLHASATCHAVSSHGYRFNDRPWSVEECSHQSILHGQWLT